MNPNEEIIVSTFIAPNKRNRWRLLLNDPKRRHEILNLLYHLSDLDPARSIRMTRGNSVELITLLQAEGSNAEVYVMSTNREVDGQILPLADAVHRAGSGYGDGAILLCISDGALGFYFGEQPVTRALLKKPKAKK